MKAKVLMSAGLILLIMGGCNERPQLNNRVPVAKVGEKYLYEDELPNLFTSVQSPEDSISIVKSFIDKWVKKELVLKRAEVNLSDEYIAEVDRKLSDTRASLMIYQYEQQMMLQKMDTVVADSTIERYYNENIEQFTLTTTLVKALYIKIPVEAPNIDKVMRWYKSDSQEELQNLESYCYQFAEKYDDFGEEWTNALILTRELPVDFSDTERFIRNNHYYQTSDSLYRYFINIRDYRLKGTVAPLEYVQNEIRNVIQNNRKLEFLENLEIGIYNEALNENGFRIFEISGR